MDRLLIIGKHDPSLSDFRAKTTRDFQILDVDSGKLATEILRKENVSVVLLNLSLPDCSFVELITAVHSINDPQLPVIIRTEESDAESAITALRQGAADFIHKSYGAELMLQRINQVLARRDLENRVGVLQSAFIEQQNRFVFASDAMKEVNYELTRLAKLRFDVLIVGESGVGKDMAASQIHLRSSRRDKPFIPIPIRSLNESLIESELFGHEKGAFSGADRARIGKLEAAGGGTVYIPEISNLTEAVQLKLLQFMQYKTFSRVGQDARTREKQLDVRIISATNEDLEEQVRQGRIREDFYHRVAGVTLTIPPLRDRIDDIEPLTSYFLRQFGVDEDGVPNEISPEVLSAFKAHTWPGNVRELENWIKSAIAFSKDNVLTLDDFPHFVKLQPSLEPCRVCLTTRFQVLPEYRVAEQHFKRAYFQEVMNRAGDRISQGAAIAGITPQGLRKLLAILDIGRNAQHSASLPRVRSQH